MIQLDLAAFFVFMGIPSGVTGLCFWAIQKTISKRDEKREELDKARERNETLLIKSVGAAIALGEATAHAIRDGKCNGEMTKALEYAQKVKHEQKDFLTEKAIKNFF